MLKNNIKFVVTTVIILVAMGLSLVDLISAPTQILITVIALISLDI
jgi:hypothetical protein